MTAPTKEEMIEAIKEVVNGVDSLNKVDWVTEEKKIVKHVREVCGLLHTLAHDESLQGHQEKLQGLLRRYFSEIYWCLKLHLAFHLGWKPALAHKELRKLGRDFLKLPDSYLDRVPDITHVHDVVDPGSKVLEMLSYIVDQTTAERGSKQHADAVMEQAKSLFSVLSSKNIFQPKVLVKVSHNDNFFVGSSVSVSAFLRPLCLHNRIKKFKCRLKKAVVLAIPLHPLGNQTENWLSSAFKRKNFYTTPKDPCRNCRVQFCNLEGFISSGLEEADRDTFLGACAEYIPVNELINDDTQDSVAVKGKLEQNRERCLDLFKNYKKIIDKCYTYKSMKMEELTVAYGKVTQFIHIFGYKPGIKM